MESSNQIIKELIIKKHFSIVKILNEGKLKQEISILKSHLLDL